MFKEELGEIEYAVPIGNHELKRHLVFELMIDEVKYVLKMYYKKNRWNREIFALNELKHLPVPKVNKYGVINDIEWLLMSYVDGEIFLDLEDKLSTGNVLNLYYELGQYLASIHNHQVYDFIGSPTIDGKAKDIQLPIIEMYERKLSSIIKHVKEFNHDEQDLIDDAIKLLKNRKINTTFEPRLCHGDLKSRNVMIKEVDGNYQISGLIDFEQTTIGNPDNEVLSYMTILSEDNLKRFLAGYQTVRKIDVKDLEESLKDSFLISGLDIISWSKEVAYDYYLEGIEKIKKGLILYGNK
jgi:aminoglycoside phosphotransferase (APT) family kinase protein